MVFLDHDEACDCDDAFFPMVARAQENAELLPVRQRSQGGRVTIPEVSREELLEAVEKFDRELRDSQEFAGWENKLNYRYAIDYEGRRYPVKTIISLATNVPHWPAPGSADTELGVLMEPEVCHGETEVYTGVQA
jgi:hypothetical protein